MTKHDMIDRTGICVSLFWIGPAEGRSMESSMKPDMDLVMALRDRDLKVRDLIAYQIYDGNAFHMLEGDEAAKKIHAIEDFLVWFTNHR